MGRVASSLIKRPVVNWNVENRAQKLLEKQDKPEMAPRHPSSQQLIDQFSKEHPEVLEEQAKKNNDLAKMLEGLVVTPQKFGEITSKKKNLPENRSKVPEQEFGYLEPETIRPGRCSIRQAMQFLGNHYSDPDNFDTAVIAKEYNLDKNQVNRVLQYFSVFLVQIPRQQSTEQTDTDTSSVPMRALKPSLFQKKIGSAKQDSNTDKFSHTTISGSSETK